MIKLGSTVKHKVTEAIGVVLSRIEYIDGSISYGVQYKEVSNGKPTSWITTMQCLLETVEDEERIIGFKELPKSKI